MFSTRYAASVFCLLSLSLTDLDCLIVKQAARMLLRADDVVQAIRQEKEGGGGGGASPEEIQQE